MNDVLDVRGHLMHGVHVRRTVSPPHIYMCTYVSQLL